jgi:hypothetical protein
MGTALPNMAAGFLIAGNSFADKPNVLVFLAGAGLIVILIVFPIAAELGKRAKEQPTPAVPEPAASTKSEDETGHKRHQGSFRPDNLTEEMQPRSIWRIECPIDPSA